MSGIRVDRALAEALRRVLDAAGYDEPGLSEELGAPADLDLGRGDPAVFARRLATDGRLPALARLFFLGEALPRASAAAALEPLALEPLEAAGVIERAGDDVSARVRLAPHAGLLVAADRAGASAGLDVVPGPNPAARTLWRLTMRAPVDSALDLGAGSGVQALSLAGHAGEVVATDVNPRALALLSLGAHLNGIENVRCVEGSWFEPVAGERFDLIVSNPPFVVSPDSVYTFRDSGLPGDDVSRMLVRQAPAHLREGGYALIASNWVHEHGGDWSAPLRSWVEGTGCDALLLHYASEDPLLYAAVWNQTLVGGASEEFERALDRWIDYYRERRIAAIGLGAIVLRRRAGGSPHVHAVSAVSGPVGPGGDHVARLLDAPAELARCEGDALLAARLELVDGHEVQQRLSRRGSGYARHAATFRFDPGIGVEARLAADALPVLFACDGRRPLGELIGEAARDAGVEEGDLSEGAMAAARTLIAQGFMVVRSD